MKIILRFDFKDSSRMLFYLILIGIIAGLGSVFFQFLCDVGMHYFLDMLAGYRPEGPKGEISFFSPTSTPLNKWMLIFLPTIGGAISGFLVYAFAPEAEGHGTDAAIEAYHKKEYPAIFELIKKNLIIGFLLTIIISSIVFIKSFLTVACEIIFFFCSGFFL